MKGNIFNIGDNDEVLFYRRGEVVICRDEAYLVSTWQDEYFAVDEYEFSAC